MGNTAHHLTDAGAAFLHHVEAALARIPDLPDDPLSEWSHSRESHRVPERIDPAEAARVAAALALVKSRRVSLRWYPGGLYLQADDPDAARAELERRWLARLESGEEARKEKARVRARERYAEKRAARIAAGETIRPRRKVVIEHTPYDPANPFSGWNDL